MTKQTLFFCNRSEAISDIQTLMKTNDCLINDDIVTSALNYNFNYDNIKFSESPYTNKEPIYKYNSIISYSNKNFTIDKNNQTTENSLLDKIYKANTSNIKLDVKDELFSYFSQFDEIIYVFGDINCFQYKFFEFTFSKYFNLGEDWISFFKELNIKFTALLYSFNDEVNIKDLYNERQNIIDNKSFKDLRDVYIKKDFFDYNYNLNALLFFKEALRESEIFNIEEEFLFNKEIICVLYFIYKNENINFKILAKEMEKKYINFQSLIGYLIKLKEINLLIDINHEYTVSELGKSFIRKLHKKVNDPYLLNRIQEDNFCSFDNIPNFDKSKFINLSVEEFKSKYQKYFYNTFSKQKRFARKIKK